MRTARPLHPALLPLLALALLALTACGPAAQDAGISVDPAGGAAEEDATTAATEEAPPREAEPTYDCRQVDGRQVCDTFGESDEGPGTTAPTAGRPAAEPTYDCRQVDGRQVCDTFGESDEGPGTS